MTATDARTLLRTHDTVCIRVARDRKGRVMHRQAGTTHTTIIGLLAGLVTLAAVAFPFLSLTATTGTIRSPGVAFKYYRSQVSMILAAIKDDPTKRAELEAELNELREKLKQAADRYQKWVARGENEP
jgi:cytochrome c-type biogenesis protein CcmH/NrfG